MTEHPIAPSSLDELPDHRREHLLWQHALTLDYQGVEDLVLELVQQPCRWRWNNTPDGLTDASAVLGDDGRYHLLLADTLVCDEDSHRPARAAAAGRFGHEQWCYWWTDGTSYRVQAPQTIGPRRPVGTTRPDGDAHSDVDRGADRRRHRTRTRTAQPPLPVRRRPHEMASTAHPSHTDGPDPDPAGRRVRQRLPRLPTRTGRRGRPRPPHRHTPPTSAGHRKRVEYLGFSPFD